MISVWLISREASTEATVLPLSLQGQSAVTIRAVLPVRGNVRKEYNLIKKEEKRKQKAEKKAAKLKSKELSKKNK